MALSNAVSGTLTSATNTQSTPFSPYVQNGPLAAAQFNLEVRGTFVATWQLQRSIDGGANWVAVTSQGNALSFTGPMSEVLVEGQAGVLYAINVTSYTSGTLNWKFNQ